MAELRNLDRFRALTGREDVMPSTAIADIDYDRVAERLVVTFVTGHIYEYIDVPLHVAASFDSNFSKGTLFNDYIRDRYDFRELTPAHYPNRVA
jgi:hypothetical protein